MSTNGAFATSSFGFSAVVVGLSLNVLVTAPRGCGQGGFFKKLSGGTVAIVPGISAITTAGYILGDTEVVQTEGPASFYLAAAGTTITVGVVWKQGANYSTPIG